MNWRAAAIVCGLLAPVVLLAGTGLSALAYLGRTNEPFSIRDHFISELGEVGTSSRARLFNATLIASGAIVSGFMLGLGMHLGSKSAWAGMVLGIWSGISCALVGIIPMNNLVPHVIVSFSFFYSGMGAVALLTQAIWLDRRQAAAPVICGLTTKKARRDDGLVSHAAGRYRSAYR